MENMEKVILKFNSQDIIEGKNHADLGIYGDFYATKIEFDRENPYFVHMYGTLKTCPKHMEYQGDVLVGEIAVIDDAEITAEISSLLDYSEEEIQDLTAAEIFNLGWDNWYTRSIPPEWDY